MFDRLPTPFGLVRGGVAPDHQKIKSVTRVYDKIAAHPEFRFFGNVEMGRDLTRDDLSALLPRDHLRGRRAHRPAHGDPARGPARQPLGHRVRRLVQRPPRLPQPRASTSHARARGGGRQRQRGDGRRPHPAASSPEELAGDRHRRATRSRRCARATACARSTCSAAAAPPRRPSPTRRSRSSASCRTSTWSSTPRPCALDPLSAADVEARPNRTRDRNLELLREYAERPPSGAPQADRAPLPGVAGGDHRHRARRGPHHRPQRAVRERGRQHPAPPDRAPDHDSARAGVPGDRLPGGSAARDPVRRDARDHPQRVGPDHRDARRSSRSRASTWSDGSSAGPRGSSGPTSPTPRRRSTACSPTSRRVTSTRRGPLARGARAAARRAPAATSSPTRTGS